MSKKAPLDMSNLLAAKGQGVPANDAPARPIVTETRKEEPRKEEARKDEMTNRRIAKPAAKTPSRDFVNLGFKVPKEFRHRLRLLAAKKDISLVDMLREAVELYEKTYPA